MKFRFALALVSFSLSLAISADRPTLPCRGCWLPSPVNPTIDQGFGVNIHFTDPQPGEIKMIADAGFRWVRMDFKWDLTEPGPGHYDFSPYDRLLKALAPFGLRAMFILDYGNPIYGEGAPRTEDARQAFARWAVAAARHFADRGVIWEVYNEPNNPAFWQTTDANEYAALAAAVKHAFRDAVPDERLIGPSVGEMDFAFLETAFSAGLLDSFAGVSVHPYLRTNPENVANEYSRLRDLIDRYRSADSGNSLPIISGEWGYSSVWRGMNEEMQALMLARQFLTNAANGIPLSIWYDWRDDGADPNDPEHHFGLVRNPYHRDRAPVYEPKPAYLAARTLLRHLAGFRFEKRLVVGSDDDYVLLFTKGNDQRLAAWTSSPATHTVSIPATSGQFKLTSCQGEDGSRLAVNQGALSVKLSAAPVYLARAD